MNDFDDRSELTALASLPREKAPPPDVEERVVRELRKRGLIAAPRSRWMGRWWHIAAAALIAATIGWMGRALIEPTRPPALVGREFLLLLSEPTALLTTKSEAELVEEYRGWATTLGRQGSLVHSGKLLRGGQLMRSSIETQESSTAGGALDTITGYFLVRADSLEEAIELASTCPHLTYGGEISVRTLEQI